MEEENINETEAQTASEQNDGSQSENQESSSPKMKSATVINAGAKVAGKFGGPVGKAVGFAAKTGVGRGVINGVGNAIDSARNPRGVVNNQSENGSSATKSEPPGSKLMNKAASKLLSKAIPGAGILSGLGGMFGGGGKSSANPTDLVKKQMSGMLMKLVAPYLLGGAGAFIIIMLITASFSTQGNDMSVTHRDPNALHESCYNYDGTLSDLCVIDEETGEAYFSSTVYDPRLLELFPNGVPTSESEMRQYLETITVRVVDANNNEHDLNLQVHREMAGTFQEIFQELYDMGYPIDVEHTSTFNWRTMKSSSSMSMHSYGIAVDINSSVNGGVYGPTDPNSPYFVSSDVVAVFERHGFFWGGNWSESYNDPMHFSYTNH